MKKLFAALLAGIMLVSLAACGSTGQTQSSGEGSGNTGEAITLKIAHGSAETHPLHRALLQFKEDVEATGRFEVEIYPNQQFGSDEEMLQSVKTGDLTMAVSPTSYLANDVPSMAMIELPYVFPNVATARAVLEGEWGTQELEQLKDVNLYALGYMESGMRQMTNSKHTITSPADLSGLKLRTMNVEAHIRFFNSLGASAEGSPFSELYTNLSTGVFDGEENPIAQIYANKFYEVQQYITITDHIYTTYVPVMRLDFWEGLSADDQEILNTAFASAYTAGLEMLEADEAQQLSEMEAAGCEVTTLTPEQKQAFIEAAQPTLMEYRDSIGADVYDAFAQAIKDCTVEG